MTTEQIQARVREIDALIAQVPATEIKTSVPTLVAERATLLQTAAEVRAIAERRDAQAAAEAERRRAVCELEIEKFRERAASAAEPLSGAEATLVEAMTGIVQLEAEYGVLRNRCTGAQVNVPPLHALAGLELSHLQRLYHVFNLLRM